jgi:hypothetical protein
MLWGFIPQNLLELAVTVIYMPIRPRDNCDDRPTLKVLMLPFRILVWAILVLVNYPLMLVAASISACYIRVTKGTAADVLKTSLAAKFKSGASYCCVFVFKKPFSDTERLGRELQDVAQEIGVSKSKVKLSVETEVPKPFPDGPAVECDHYVDTGYNIFKRSVLSMGGWHLMVQLFNGKPGEPTVMRCYLPGHTFDGTSCFNIMKEVIARYHGETSQIVVQTELNDEAARALRAQSFCAFLCRLPYNVLLNVSDFIWHWMTSMGPFGGSGMSFEVTHLNLTEDQSARLHAGLKSRGVKPYAGFIYAAFHAYRKALGKKPFGIVQQASMQSRLYTPTADSGVSLEKFRNDRRYVGDWLIGESEHERESTTRHARRDYDPAPTIAHHTALFRPPPPLPPSSGPRVPAKAR